MILLLLLLGFVPGEQLEFSAHYGFLNIGRMTMAVTDTLTYEGKSCLTIVSILNSNPGLNFLFSLNDTITAVTTRDQLLPCYVEEHLHEGKFTSHTRQVFDQNEGKVVYDDTLTVPISADTRDLLSFWYYLRTVNLEIGQSWLINVHKSKKNYRVACPVIKRETIETNAGSFSTLLLEPQTEDKGIFGTRGTMAIWYADTAGRYPVQIKTAIKYGKITFKLQRIQREEIH